MSSTAVAGRRWPGARILLFAREPAPGQVKTRLQPTLGATRCLALYRALLARTAAVVDRAGLAPLELWVSSNPRHESFLGICSENNIHLQQGRGLGARMAHAVTTVLAREGVEQVILIGADCPALDGNYLAAALAVESDVVIGPASDGGYVLIGLRKPCPKLFAGIDWGSQRVLQQTLERLHEAGLSYGLLNTLWDVDRPEDLPRLATLSPPLSW